MIDVEGRQPVLELLRAGRQIHKLLVAKGQKQGSIRQILALAQERGVAVQEVERNALDRISKTGHHQGVIAQAAPIEYWTLDQLLALETKPGWPRLFVLLDGVEDPHNLGSIIRTAEALGAQGVVIPKRRAAGISAAVIKASAGAVNYLPVVRVNNMANTIDALKKEGLWIAGGDMQGEICYKADLQGPLALVIGGEGRGLRRLVREKCDFLISVPMRGHVDSLNASVAAAALMYEIARQRGLAGSGN